MFSEDTERFAIQSKVTNEVAIVRSLPALVASQILCGTSQLSQKCTWNQDSLLQRDVQLVQARVGIFNICEDDNHH